MTFQYDVQRPDGTHQIINAHNPVPVTVAGLPVITDEIERNANMVRSDIEGKGDQIVASLTPLMGVVEMPELVDQLERMFKLAFWGAIGFGVVNVGVLIVLIIGVVLCR